MTDLGLDAGGARLREASEAEAAAEAEEEAALEALDEARAYHAQHPDQLGDVMGKYLDVIEEFPGTAAAAQARESIEEIQDQLLAGSRQPSPTGGQRPPIRGPEPGEPPEPPQTQEQLREELLADLTQVAEADGYLVRAHGSCDEDLAAEAASTMAACAEVIEAFTGCKPPRDTPPLEVLVFENEEAVVRLTRKPTTRPEEIARLLRSAPMPGAVLDPDTNQLYTYRSRTMLADLRRVAPEQYLRPLINGEVPTFLTWGLGHYLELAVLDSKGRRVRGSQLDQALLKPLERATAPLGGRSWRRSFGLGGGLIPVEEVVTSTEPAAQTLEEEIRVRVRRDFGAGDRAEQLKAEQWLICYWCLHGKGPDRAVAAFCKTLVKDRTLTEAYQATLGRANASGKLDEAFEKYIKDVTD
jgi:hypothetical protein